MPDHESTGSSTTDGLPVVPSMGPGLASVHAPRLVTAIDGRTVYICALAVMVAFGASLAAHFLAKFISLITNLSFHHRWSFHEGSPVGHHLGLWVIGVPIVGALIVGVMARVGSPAIRGHGIPEAMEQVLTNESRIPARMTWLKPLSAAISIGTGGPFGSEGPIIATGSALGSLLGQLIRTTAGERKTLLAAGAAAGMAATFGSPVSAVLLAVELLLFEFRPRSLIPVVLASVTADGVRILIEGVGPVFPMPDLTRPTAAALIVYVAIGAMMGVAAAAVTRITYAIED